MIIELINRQMGLGIVLLPVPATTASSEAAKVCCRDSSPATSRGDSAGRPRVDAKCVLKLRLISSQLISAATRVSGWASGEASPAAWVWRARRCASSRMPRTFRTGCARARSDHPAAASGVPVAGLRERPGAVARTARNAAAATLQRWFDDAHSCGVSAVETFAVALEQDAAPVGATLATRLEQRSVRKPGQQAQAAQAPDLRPRQLRAAATACLAGCLIHEKCGRTAASG